MSIRSYAERELEYLTRVAWAFRPKKRTEPKALLTPGDKALRYVTMRTVQQDPDKVPDGL